MSEQSLDRQSSGASTTVLAYESPDSISAPVKLDAFNGVLVAFMGWGILCATMVSTMAWLQPAPQFDWLFRSLFWTLPALSVVAFIYNLKRRSLHPFITGLIDGTMTIGIGMAVVGATTKIF